MKKKVVLTVLLGLGILMSLALIIRSIQTIFNYIESLNRNIEYIETKSAFIYVIIERALITLALIVNIILSVFHICFLWKKTLYKVKFSMEEFKQEKMLKRKQKNKQKLEKLKQRIEKIEANEN